MAEQTAGERLMNIAHTVNGSKSTQFGRTMWIMENHVKNAAPVVGRFGVSFATAQKDLGRAWGSRKRRG